GAGSSVTGSSVPGPSVTGPGVIGPSGSVPSSRPAGEPPDRASAAGPIPATPEAARNTMSALQRGWQLGRSEAEAAAQPSASGFTPRKSPSGQPFDPDDGDAGSADPDPANSADERGGE